ncbi:M36 family metallopeptidase [Pontimicrobium sp. MEBiC06410]
MGKNYLFFKVKLKSYFKALFAFTLLSLLSIQLNAQEKKKEENPRITSSNYLKELVKEGNTANYVVTSEHTSSVSGIHHTYIRQAVNGIEVVGTESSLHIKDGKTFASHVNFVQNIDNTVRNSSASISATQAITTTSQRMGYGTPTGLNVVEVDDNIERTDYQKRTIYYSKGGVSNSNIPVKQLYYYQEREGATLAWEFSIEDRNSSDWYSFIVDANTGEILNKYNLTVSCNIGGDHSNHNHDDVNLDSDCEDEYNVTNNNKTSVNTPAFVGGGTYNVYAMPVESPGHGGRSVVSDPADATGSPYGWHDTNGVAGAESNYTIGNNCDAYDDSSSTVTGTGSGTNAERANGGAALDFNFTIDTNVNNNGGSINAAVTNLFYWTNVIHDVWYIYGFDEASGNFQVNNYGNGGTAGDSVRAEAQDGSGTCNANFATPADGGRGRMQMYVCNTRDGDLDNVVIVHEYGHGLSTRLTGGAANSGCLNNSEQMGEGWGDFIGLVMTMEPGDQGTDQRGIGTWLVGQGPNGAGIRPQPYSTTNTQSYADLGSAVVPHGVGSIWSAILWKLNWALIDDHGWDPDIYYGTGGNNICLRLVIEGMKLQGCNPGFVDGRDAILAADEAIYGGANASTIWEVFAGAGLGASASQGSSNSNSDGTTATDLPPTTFAVSRTSVCITEGTISDLGGGRLFGGTYSGPNVTDNGDGITFTFDTASAGVGDHTVTYTDNQMPATSIDQIITVTDGLPVISCQNATVTLDANGAGTITTEDLVTNLVPSAYVEESITFATETITGGTAVTLGDDAGTAALNIGFDFNFYGTTYTQFYIASNGFISFDGSGMTGAASYTPTAIPNTGNPNTMIAFAWDDLSPNAGGTIQYGLVGTAPNRKMVVEFNAVPLYNATETVTAQVHLHEGTSRIEFHYTNAENNGGTRTAGIENAGGTEALPISGGNLTAWSTANDAYALYQPEAKLADNCGNSVTTSLSQSVFSCSDTGDVTVTITADDGNGGVSTCEAIVTVTSGPECRVSVSPKVYLQGAALNPNTGEETLMRDDLRVDNLIPTTSPYPDNLTCNAAVFNTTGANAIVDWVQVELRDQTTSTLILDSKSALLQRDGDVVDVDGTSPVTFNQAGDRYYVVIKHRNHLGVMTGASLLLSNTTTAIDFTNSGTLVFGTDAQTSFGMPSGVLGMWAGDSTGNGLLNYLGGSSDVPSIRAQVFNDPDNSIFGGPPVATYGSTGYYGTDVNMDGLTYYAGSNSDVLFIRNNTFNNPSNSVFGGPPAATYNFTQQLPEGTN